MEKMAVVEAQMEETVTNIAVDRLGKFITLIGGKEGALELSVWNLLELT